MFKTLLLAAALTAPTPVVAQTPKSATPTEMADGFFRALQNDQVEKAYKGIWEGTLMDRKQADVENLVSQNMVVLKNYGGVLGWELISETTITPSLIDRVYLVKTQNLPLFYKIQFYRPGPKWQVTNLFFTDTYKNIP